MTALLIVLAPFLLLHVLSWTSLPDKVPVKTKELGPNTGKRRLGTSDLFSVTVDVGSPIHTVMHERQHIRDKWRLCWIGYLIFGQFKRGKEWREARGYAVSVKHGRPLDDAARGMAAGVGIGLERAKRLIEARL